MTFTRAELDYLSDQFLGRLATVGPDGAPQNNPTAFTVVQETGTIDIHGLAMGKTRKFHNVRRDGRVSFVVDDIASRTPWKVRGLEIRGVAEAVEGVEPPEPYLSREVIRIRPTRIISWGLEPGQEDMRGRDV
ncbi:PPOX class F420-dependent oxidoreductase [Streptosporangium saharense]|uniref:Pyridoxamine 5'-phosphate oxidase family protein n=1 Tax=Streptosporangium saharense TaxID=1706840 RepID=A0A7W7VMZ7_9ACTN|nr:PPOX class F420-dependent oxidoreductase [Streptosporangium saharense]MBB4916153.1 pyridoxamine 5'-phosphate oxidase family protein [Streptosporangium saharense]